MNRNIVNQHRNSHQSNDRMRAVRREETQQKQEVTNSLKSKEVSAQKQR